MENKQSKKKPFWETNTHPITGLPNISGKKKTQKEIKKINLEQREKRKLKILKEKQDEVKNTAITAATGQND